jgi:hypothetical protein
VATSTHPGPWWLEEPETVLTVQLILEEQAERLEQMRKRR